MENKKGATVRPRRLVTAAMHANDIDFPTLVQLVDTAERATAQEIDTGRRRGRAGPFYQYRDYQYEGATATEK